MTCSVLPALPIRPLALLALLLLSAPLGAAPTTEVSSSRVALIIGNADYATAPLANPVNDARAMATSLAELGFQVIKLENATHEQMTDAIVRFEESLDQDHTALFYYAGHGLQVRGRNYLVPVDAEITSEARARTEGVDLGLLTSAMEYARSKVNFIILDACRNNPFERSLRGGSRGLAAVDAASGTLIAYATAPGSVAADGSGDNGVYTAALLTALREPGLQAEEVFKRVRTQVHEQTGGAQVPWESSSLTGDFVFNAQTSAAPAPAPAPSGPAPVRADREALFWNTIKDSNHPAMFEEYLRSYPDGTFAGLARLMLQTLPGQGTSSGGDAEQPQPAPRPPASPAPAPLPEREAPAALPPGYEAVRGPSFGCTGQTLRPVETLLCEEPALAHADGVMGRVYSALRATLPGAGQRRLRDQQREWIADRDRRCPVHAAALDSRAIWAESSACLLRETADRARTLHAALQQAARRP